VAAIGKLVGVVRPGDPGYDEARIGWNPLRANVTSFGGAVGPLEGRSAARVAIRLEAG
jgi:hypothetical protein